MIKRTFKKSVKIFSAVLAAVIAAASFAGCSGKNDNTSGGSADSQTGKAADLGGRTITYMTWWEEPVQGSNQQAVEYWETKTKIEEKYNCKFDFVYASESGWQSKVTASILSGDPICDVFSTEYEYFYGMNKSGLLYPVSDLKNFDFSDSSKWWAPGMEYSRVDGKQYGMCLSGGEFSLILYNKDLLKKNNQPDLYELQREGKLTWSRITEIAKACTDASKGVYGMAPSQFPRDLLYLVGEAYGGKIVTRKGDSADFDCTVNSAEMVNGFSDVNRWYSVDKTVLPCNGDYKYSSSQFKAGNVAMFMGVTPPTYYGNYGFELGACLVPAGRDSKSFEPFINLSTGTLSFIPACADKPEEIALVWNEIGAKTGRVNWEIYYQDYLSDDIMECLYQSIDYTNQKKYTIDYGYTLLSLWQNNNTLFDTTTKFVSSSNSAASFIQSLENIYAAKILDMKASK